MSAIAVIKRDVEGRETWRYTGTVLERGADFVRLEARFNRADDYPFQDAVLRVGDRFVEGLLHRPLVQHLRIRPARTTASRSWYCSVKAARRCRESPQGHFVCGFGARPVGFRSRLDSACSWIRDEYAACGWIGARGRRCARRSISWQGCFRRFCGGEGEVLRDNS